MLRSVKSITTTCPIENSYKESYRRKSHEKKKYFHFEKSQKWQQYYGSNKTISHRHSTQISALFVPNPSIFSHAMFCSAKTYWAQDSMSHVIYSICIMIMTKNHIGKSCYFFSKFQFGFCRKICKYACVFGRKEKLLVKIRLCYFYHETLPYEKWLCEMCREKCA